MTSDKRILKKLSSFKPLKLAVQLGLVIGLTAMGTNAVFADAREQAKRMHDRLAGIPPTNEVLCAMEWLIANAPNGAEQAAHLVMSKNPAADGARIPDFGGIPGSCGTVDNSLSKKAFYSVSLKNFVTPWTNEAQSVLEDLNDYSALVIGMIRDDKPFDTVLSADLLYKGNITNPSLANDNNDHFKALQDGAYDLSNPAVLIESTQTGENYLPASPTNGSDRADPAGVVTTRAASLAFFTGGTNRLMWRSTSMNFLCRDLEQMKDVSRTPDRIRQDVSRSPGGDSSIFLSACMGCHAGMDPLAGAYAYYDHQLTSDDDGNEPTGRMLWKENSTMFDGTISSAGVGEALFNQSCASCHNATDRNVTGRSAAQITAAINNVPVMNGLNTIAAGDIAAIANFLAGSDTPQPITVTQKHLINAGNFKYGYVTVGDGWTNYWREGPNSELQWGWNTRFIPADHGANAKITSGNGAASLGYEVTSTKAFAQCQVEKVYEFVCMHELRAADAAAISSIVDAMPAENYSMKNVFAKVAPMCMGN